ncbi:MAG: HEAT repeat domain-containing protein, partial [Candidatus Thorarchaeota archaeon]
FYGFTILMIEGTKPIETPSSQGYSYTRYRRTWLEENLSQNAVMAVRQLTGEFGEAVDMDTSYKTLGNSRIFKKKCTKTTADILADAVRLTLYKAPGNRITSARKLGLYEDSRALPFLHRCFISEKSRNVRICISESLGKVGHMSSIDILNERANLSGRYLTKESIAAVQAMGKIYSPCCRTTLTKLLNHGGNIVRATAIQALSRQEPSNLVDLISPYLKDNSKPVVRATVQALMNLGSEGETMLESHAVTIMRKLVSDKIARPILTKLFRAYELGELRDVQQYFSETIKKYGDTVRKFRKESMNTSPSYYIRRKENRANMMLLNSLRGAISFLKPPFLKSLLTNIHELPDIPLGSQSVSRILRHSTIAGAIAEKKRNVQLILE